MPLSLLAGEPDREPDDVTSILIVDDLPEKLLVFETVLQELGQNIVSVRSGSEALREILRTEFAVILLDVNMPDIDGFETAGLIRKYKRSAHTPIIFITSYADELQTVRGYSLGAVDYILSPVVPEVLRSKVKVFVELQVMQRRLRRQADERVALARAEAARLAAERATQRSEFLSQASRVLGGSLDVRVGMQKLLELIVPAMASRATLALGDTGLDGTPVLTRSSLPDGAEPQLSESRLDALPRAERDALERALAGAARLCLPATPLDVVSVPLRVGERILGALCVRFMAARPGAADLGMLDDLADRAAIAFENARLYRSLQVEIEERCAAEDKLKASSRRKDEFLAMLSHELRNPLAPIRNALEVIRRVAQPHPKLSWATEVTGRQIDHLTQLIEELLDVARISQGKIVLQSELTDLRKVVALGVETARPFIEGRAHVMTVRSPDTPVWMRGDPTRLAQVVANLLHNSAKYTQEGGSIELSLTAADGTATICVVDNGMGIEAELLPNVFELFEQGTRSLDRSQGGLGIGLTLVHRLVQLHKGQVRAFSAGPGQGAEFRVTLPCLMEMPTGDAFVEPAPIASAPVRCRVLVVDDNRDAADTTAMCLEIAGHEVMSVGDGPAALACVADFAPEVVVLDIGLPGLDGYEVAGRLRRLPATAGAFLVALTGYGQQAERRRAFEAGFDDHLIKPAEPARLLQLISSWCEARSAAAASAG